MGVTVYFEGKWYWFESADDLIEVLDGNCDDAGYDNELRSLIEYD